MPDLTWPKHVSFAVLFLLLAGLYLAPVVENPATVIPGGFRDAYSILWQVWWFGKTLGQETVSPFYTTYHAFPAGDRYFTAQNICFYLPGAVLSRFVGPVAATNAMCILSLGLVGYGAFLLYREIHGSRSAGAAGGLLMMVSSFVTVSLNAGVYYLVASAGMTLLFLFFSVRAVKRGGVRDWLAAGVLFSGVGLTSGYCALIAGISFAALACPLAAVNKPRNMTVVTGSLLAACIAGLILAVPYGGLLRGAGAEDLAGAASFSRLTASWPYLLRSAEKRVSGPSRDDGQYLVNHIGCLVVLLALGGLFSPAPGAGKRSIIAAVMALFWLLVATGSLPAAALLLGRFGMRNMHRFLLGASICLVWLAAGAVGRLASAGGRFRRVLAALLVAAAVAESLVVAGPACPVETLDAARSTTDIFIASLPGEAIVELPMSTPYFSNTMRSYASQIHHGKKLVNPSTNVFSDQALTVSGKALLWELERCIRDGTWTPVAHARRQDDLEALGGAGVCAVVCNEAYIMRVLGSGGPARVNLVRMAFSGFLGAPVDCGGGRVVYVIEESRR